MGLFQNNPPTLYVQQFWSILYFRTKGKLFGHHKKLLNRASLELYCAPDPCMLYLEDSLKVDLLALKADVA